MSMELLQLEEQLERDRISQVRMDCEARVSRYWPKSCRGGRNAPRECVPADSNHNKSCYDPPNISPLAPKKWQIVFISQKNSSGIELIHLLTTGKRHRGGFDEGPNFIVSLRHHHGDVSRFVIMTCAAIFRGKKGGGRQGELADQFKLDAENQWRKIFNKQLKDVFHPESELIDDGALFWRHIFSIKDAVENPFSRDLATLALNLDSLLISNATVERVFSRATSTKTKVRNRMCLELSDSILRMKMTLGERGAYLLS
ncbi:hypothetical protein TNCV_4067831 [Trichonephila clavipes]|nr:hypothetical protein TNCV_4067831 [Trichonephila clavipes]